MTHPQMEGLFAIQKKKLGGKVTAASAAPSASSNLCQQFPGWPFVLFGPRRKILQRHFFLKSWVFFNPLPLLWQRFKVLLTTLKIVLL